MATVSKSFTPSDVFQGPADIYLGVANPASANPPVEGTNTLTLDSVGQPPIGTTGQIATISLGATGSGGSGYAVGDTLLITGGGGSNGLARVLTVSGGAIATLLLLKGGSGYATGNNLAISPVTGAGTGATINILTITSGYHLGLTEGPASININPKFNEIMADQYSAPIDAAFVSQACEIDFVVKEFVLSMMTRLFAGLFSATYFDLAAGSSNPATDLVQIGSSPSSAALLTSLLLVAPRRDVANKYLYALGYRCFIKSAIQMSAQRSKEATIKLKFGLLADTSRVAKDMALQIVRQN